jgi:hypothetical protein
MISVDLVLGRLRVRETHILMLKLHKIIKFSRYYGLARPMCKPGSSLYLLRQAGFSSVAER